MGEYGVRFEPAWPQSRRSLDWVEIISFYIRVSGKSKTENKNRFHLQWIIENIVYQGSVSGLFRPISDLFYKNYNLEFENSVDDTTLHIYGQGFSSIEVLERNVNRLFNWLQQHVLIAKPLFNQAIWVNFYVCTWMSIHECLWMSMYMNVYRFFQFLWSTSGCFD